MYRGDIPCIHTIIINHTKIVLSHHSVTPWIQAFSLVCPRILLPYLLTCIKGDCVIFHVCRHSSISEERLYTQCAERMYDMLGRDRVLQGLMRSMNLISPRMELNQYHLLTKKVLFRLSYRGVWCSRSAKPFATHRIHRIGSLGPTAACALFTQCAFSTRRGRGCGRTFSFKGFPLHHNQMLIITIRNATNH